ncbi:MAG TPA: SRPBCC family protein [Acidimicrobiales bacterium]|nr:SRPBCC family protein [Acidimicrobiales bacterium]
MELTNEFRVAVPVSDAWAILTDVERIAPCLPGAQLQEVHGNQYKGIVKVKVGPISAQYAGTASFLEQDVATHRAVLRAEGRDTRGQGNANAMVTATLTPDGDGTSVSVVTDLTITGKVAQFGRGVLADVSGKLIGQFVENLERDVLSDSQPSTAAAAAPAADPAAAAPEEAPAEAAPAEVPASTNGSEANGSEAARSTVRKIDHPDAAPVDLIQAAGQPVAKRVVPLAGGIIAALFIVSMFRRRRRRHRH